MAKKEGGIVPRSKADFDAAIAQFAKDVRVDVGIITNEQMRLMLRDAMTFTPPMPKGGGRGLSVAAHTAGKGKLSKDVKRIFVPMDQGVRSKGVFLRQVINAVQGNGPSGRSWMDFIARRGFDVYLLDLPGYGRSSRPPAMRAARSAPPSASITCTRARADRQMAFAIPCKAVFLGQVSSSRRSKPD